MAFWTITHRAATNWAATNGEASKRRFDGRRCEATSTEWSPPVELLLAAMIALLIVLLIDSL